MNEPQKFGELIRFHKDRKIRITAFETPANTSRRYLMEVLDLEDNLIVHASVTESAAGTLKQGDRVRVAKVSSHDPYGAFTEAVLGKSGVVMHEDDGSGCALVYIEGEGILAFRVEDLEVQP